MAQEMRIPTLEWQEKMDTARQQAAQMPAAMRTVSVLWKLKKTFGWLQAYISIGFKFRSLFLFFMLPNVIY